MDEARSILADVIQPLFKNFVLLSPAKMQKLGAENSSVVAA